jgi:hypothetical protein
MGLLLLCNGTSFSCKYTEWINFREELANASVRYLQKIYTEMLYTNLEQTDEQTRLEQLLEYMDVNNCATLQDYSQLFTDGDFVNTFVYYRLGGVFALLNKPDYGGLYSVGNATDIAETMEIIREYVKYDDVKVHYENVIKVFKESSQTNNNIVIC